MRAGIGAAGLLAVLVLAARLRPASEGIGTHESLGLPSCSFHSVAGTPCPTCGMTTAFAHAADANPLAAIAAQPMGALLALAAATGFWLCLHIAATGSMLGGVVERLLGTRVLWIGFAGIAGAWLYKIASS